MDSNVIVDLLTEDPEWLEWSAAALVGGLTLLTRAPRRYRSYFPALRMIAP